MTKINIGFAITEGIFKRKITVAQLDSKSFSLIDTSLPIYLTPLKKNIYQLEGVLSANSEISLKDLDVSTIFNLFDVSTKTKQELNSNYSELTNANMTILVLLGILNSIQFTLKNKNAELFLYWLTNNKEIDQEFKTITTNYLNNIFKSL